VSDPGPLELERDVGLLQAQHAAAVQAQQLRRGGAPQKLHQAHETQEACRGRSQLTRGRSQMRRIGAWRHSLLHFHSGDGGAPDHLPLRRFGATAVKE
jgi:hypothetical protein